MTFEQWGILAGILFGVSGLLLSLYNLFVSSNRAKNENLRTRYIEDIQPKFNRIRSELDALEDALEEVALEPSEPSKSLIESNATNVRKKVVSALRQMDLLTMVSKMPNVQRDLTVELAIDYFFDQILAAADSGDDGNGSDFGSPSRKLVARSYLKMLRKLRREVSRVQRELQDAHYQS